MIKNIALSIDTTARVHMEKPLRERTPAVADAFKLIGSLTMLLGGIAIPPSNKEQLNGFFQPDHEYYRWMLGRNSESTRLSIFVSTARLSCLRVEVRWYKKAAKHHHAELMTLFTEDGPQQTSWTHEGMQAAA